MHLWSGSFEKNRDVKNIIKVSRNKVYAHIFEISNICIDYCDGILKLFNQRTVYEDSNHDDEKHLFGGAFLLHIFGFIGDSEQIRT